MKKLLLGCVLAFSSTTCFAQTMMKISPLGFVQEANRKDMVTLTNPGNSPVRFQAWVEEWTQEDGKDLFVKTNSVKAGPAMVLVQPKSEAKVRIIPMEAFPTSEKAYYIVIMQLPDPSDEVSNGVTAKLGFTYRLPLFYRPKGSVSKIASSCQAGKWAVSNNGSATAKLALGSGNGGLIGYVQPGSTMTYDYPCTPKTILVDDQPQAL